MTGGERNPFPARGTMSMEEHVRDGDILDAEITGPTVMLTPVDRLTAWVRRYLDVAALRSRNSGQAVFLHGEHGSGKTHAIRYALGQAAAKAAETGALRLYVKAQDGDFVALYRRLMSQVGQDRLRELALAFRGVLAVERFGARFGTDAPPALLAEVRENPARLALLYEELLVEPGSVLEAEAGELERVSDDGQEFQRALAGLLEPANEEAAYTWFTGRDLDLAEAERLGVSGPLDDPDQCRFGLQLLTALSTRAGRPIIVVIDQCERLVLDRPDNVGLLHSLVERVPQESGMLLLSGSTAAWHALPDDLRQRFGGNHVDTSLISPEEARQVLDAYAGWVAFHSDAVSELLRVSGGNIRLLLQLAWRLVEAAPPGRTVIDRALVREVAASALVTREDVELAVEAWLHDERAPYVRDWQGNGGKADFAVLSDFGPQLLIDIKEALFTTSAATRFLKQSSLLRRAREQGWPARVLLIVVGYVNPAALPLLRRAAHDVVVFTGAGSLDRLRGLAAGLDTTSIAHDSRMAPYRGLAPFTEADAELFYGREQEVDRLVAALAGRSPVAGLLMVTGASGAGKSSLLRAGLLPALARGAMGEQVARWRRIVLVPGVEPVSELAVHLASALGTDVVGLRDRLRTNPEDAHLLVNQVMGAWPETPEGERGLILVVDQFEEIFTLADPEERKVMVRALHVIATKVRQAFVIISVRGDFIDQCARHPELLAALNDRPFVLGPMSEPDLVRAIRGPVMTAGLTIEPGLVETILGDVGALGGSQGFGTLPLLSQAMLAVWERRESGRLTLRAYLSSGGVAQGVSNRAEEVYGRLTDDQQRAARALFRRLTSVTRDSVPVRRTIPRRLVEDDEELAAVVEAFGSARLLIIDRDTLQIAHDILLHAWPRLRDWLREDLEDTKLINEMLDDALEWEAAGREVAFLYRGSRLATAREWLERDSGNRPGLHPIMVDYIEASWRHQRRATRTRRLLLVSQTILLVTSLVAVFLAMQSLRTVQEQREKITSRLLAERSVSFATDERLSTLLALAAWRISPTQEARVSLENVVSRPIPSAAIELGPVTALSFSPDGALLATGTSDGSVRLWNTADGKTAEPALAGKGSAITAIVFSGGVLTAAREDGDLLLWTVRNGQAETASRRVISSPDAATSVAVSADGTVLAAATKTGVRLWDVASGRRLREWRTQATALAFSPDSGGLAAGVGDDRVLVLDVRGPAHTSTRLAFTGHGAEVLAVAFSPDGRTLASTSADGTIRLWDVAAQRLVGAPLTGHTDAVTSVAFSPDGRILASASADRTVRLWDVKAQRQIAMPLTGFTDRVTSVVFGPAGTSVLAVGVDGTVRSWTLRGTTDLVSSACAIADGRKLTPQEWSEYVPGFPYQELC
ncbi:AAA family ATPase [Nonomuraea sp. MTCD27]|uniref:nSTAND1 domain-containing NTPase n=1 Tax=Nonomuraea sp. MTCD27 TaxID=1676747 RepID=UPI0035C13B98